MSASDDKESSEHSATEEAGLNKDRSACASDTVPLAEREARWGFTLDELHVATKVVRTLFHNPSLFVGDPHLFESRLYTMITRDRKTKRENREVYKAIMNEEKSFRRRFRRMQDIEAIRRTGMKREREEALNALLQCPQPAENTHFICYHSDGATSHVEGQGGHGVTDSGKGPSVHDRQIISLIGAFENIVRLEAVYAAGHTSVDWNTASYLVAQIYRYIPHDFGTQMPPAIFYGTIPHGASPLERASYITVLKLRIARLCAQLITFNGTEDDIDGVANETDSIKCGGQVSCSSDGKKHNGMVTERDDVSVVPFGRDILVSDSPVLRSVTLLRRCGDLSTAPSELIDALCHHVATDDALCIFERVLVEGVLEAWDTAVASAGDGLHGDSLQSANASLNVFIARRLYSMRRYRDLGESPFHLPTRPPVSEDQEIDGYCAFQDVQQYSAGRPIPPDSELRLSRTVACHACRVRYDMLHPYYYSMCHLCGEYNFNKRLLTRDLRGKVVLLTGCRIKIGFAMALSLLRCGAELVGTTRFAHEALARFQREPDYEVWKCRLHLFSLDLRDLWLVTQFCAFVRQRFTKLFAIINNAAQTIARTREYTAQVRRVESHPPAELHQLLYDNLTVREWHRYFLGHSSVTIGEALHIQYHPQDRPFLNDTAEAGCSSEQSGHEGPGSGKPLTVASRSALVGMSPVASSSAFVFDRYDSAAEESDQREKNSWVMQLAEVEGSEAAEVMAINALSPFIINSKLKPCLLNREGDLVPDESRFIINVSAMEGQFYRFKQTTHPHTNMAKAALNMMTRTSGEDYAQDGIYMNSVDTGWITDESPKLKKERRAEHQQLCPLDEVDAAARCLDLIYCDSKEYGKFFKDFKEIPW
ncbi:putative short chain dehydrogenase Enoyl (Acyl carrier protein) reductase [Trypanosoma vivax]|uniref:Putative oxidoreductase-like protein n=1 Tax=Trypanosoma vivax (strain Y486) TaxID=1055687 RepID=G0UC14_TRYVY|nr:putative short chain dehydrogenase Enoyl (Acyl carrier protein) reductase [Trypanosoma vivax]CCC53362.1 putative oxidoreductase-like protein [Trypanosoma vivax Y486]